MRRPTHDRERKSIANMVTMLNARPDASAVAQSQH
jgi:hypothetical protein